MRDEIIKMAHGAGLHIATDVNWMPIIGYEHLERFFHMAQAAEREACAKVCEEQELRGGFAIHCVKDIRARGQA